MFNTNNIFIFQFKMVFERINRPFNNLLISRAVDWRKPDKMAEVDSDEESHLREAEEQSNENASKKLAYTKATRDVSTRPQIKKAKLAVDSGENAEELNPDEIEYEDDEEYYKKFMTAKENEPEDEMEMLRMQLECEKEEAERKSKAGTVTTGTTTEVKTRIDDDGTEYEWDPVVKGWFPKVRLYFFLSK